MPNNATSKTIQELKSLSADVILVPAFKTMADTGTFNVVLQTSVGKLPEKK